jgi:hypothetical protein
MAEPGPAVVVKGMAEFQRALAHADRSSRLGVRRELRDIARPIANDAQQLALGTITGMAASPKWAGMRIGVTRKLVYVAPRQKGARGKGPRARPNLADLMMSRAMEPALERHRGELETNVERMLDRVADGFNHGT